MSDGTCKTCKWWDVDDEGVESRHSCLYRPRFQFEVAATAVNDNDPQGRLYTGPDFGCVHHTLGDRAVTSGCTDEQPCGRINCARCDGREEMEELVNRYL